MQANGVNYYKGVLLCSRPNQSPSINKQKPFCGRVNVKDQIGLVPTKQYDEHKTRKRQLPVLNNHKKWLQKFKKQIQQTKTKEQLQEDKKLQNLQKIKQQGRQRVKQTQIGKSPQTFVAKQTLESNNLNLPKGQSVTQTKLPANAHKKKAKPAWAQTQKQAENNQDLQVDQLLGFFQKGDTQDVKDYLTDDDVKKVLQDLKNKIENIKNQGDQWKNKEHAKIQQERKNTRQQARNPDDKDDVLSRISRQSGSQSVTSQKTVQRVQQLQKKKETKQWDNKTQTSKQSSIVSVDQQIAKHIADQILRNYPNLKHHSNQSIRKMIQKQAKQQLKA